MRAGIGLLMLLVSWPASGDEARRVEMSVGEQRIMTVPGLAKVSASGTGVADVEPLGGDRFILYARGEGRASLGVFRKGKPVQMWEVIVRGQKAERLKASCSDLFGKESCANLKIMTAGDSAVLSGQIRDLETYHKVRKLKRAFPDLVLMVEVESRVLDALVEVINQELKRAGLERARVTRVAQRLILEGTVADERERRKAGLIVEAVYEAALGKQ
jgi:Flp pilus assembly secretin CpaC